MPYEMKSIDKVLVRTESNRTLENMSDLSYMGKGIRMRFLIT
jgi:hypothetical protein